jgi:hypothetical protein
MARISNEEKERLLSYLPPVARHLYDRLSGANSLTESQKRNYKAEIMQMARQRGKNGAVTEKQEPDLEKALTWEGAAYYSHLADLLVSSDEYEKLNEIGAALGEDILSFSLTELNRRKTLKAVEKKGLYKYFVDFKEEDTVNANELGVSIALRKNPYDLKDELFKAGSKVEERDFENYFSNAATYALGSFYFVYMAWCHDFNELGNLKSRFESIDSPFFVIDERNSYNRGNLKGAVFEIAKDMAMSGFSDTIRKDISPKQMEEMYKIPSILANRLSKIKAEQGSTPQAERQTLRISKELIEGNFKSLQLSETSQDDIKAIIKLKNDTTEQEKRDLVDKALKLIREGNDKQLSRLNRFEYFIIRGLADELSKQTQSAHPDREDFLVNPYTKEKGEVVFNSFADLCRTLGFDESKRRTVLNATKSLSTKPQMIYKFKDKGKDKAMRWEIGTYINIGGEIPLTGKEKGKKLVIRLNEVFYENTDKKYWLTDFETKRLMDNGEPPSEYTVALIKWLTDKKTYDIKKLNAKIGEGKLLAYLGLNYQVNDSHKKRAEKILLESLEYVKKKGFIQDYKTEQRGSATIFEFIL